VGSETAKNPGRESLAESGETFRVAEAAALKLLAYCQSHNWAGIDPYDALNSRIFKALPLLDHRIPRLVLTQALKRGPFDIRPLLLVPPTQNPKALGIFLMSLVKLSSLGLLGREGLVGMMAEKLDALRSTNTPYWCWGYSFPWQTRTLVVPRGAPNLVCTTFVANALLDAYEHRRESRYLNMAASGAAYILDKLYWTHGESVAGFGYPLPSMRHNIHNGNFLGAALLCRVSRHTGERNFIEPALKLARYSASKQHADGSWSYGELPTQQWVDNFHTGYNLCALQQIDRLLETDEFEGSIRRGLAFYRNHFFREDGAPNYFHDRTYPIDIHCVAQSIITLLALKHLDHGNISVARSVFQWAMNHMWDKRGFFYYRVLRFCTIRTSYMRWSQAWMLLALSNLLSESDLAVKHPPSRESVASVEAYS
jgi:hypothetical protein